MYFGIFSLLFFFLFSSSWSSEACAVFQLSRATLPRAFDPGIFSFSRCSARSLLNSISPFFSAPLSSIPAGYGWESRRGRFRWRRRSLAFIGERRSPPRAEDCNFEARLFAQGFLSLSLSVLTFSPLLALSLFFGSPAAHPPLITFIILLVSDTFARKSFPIDNRRLAAAVSQNVHTERACLPLLPPFSCSFFAYDNASRLNSDNHALTGNVMRAGFTLADRIRLFTRTRVGYRPGRYRCNR